MYAWNNPSPSAISCRYWVREEGRPEFGNVFLRVTTVPDLANGQFPIDKLYGRAHALGQELSS